MANLTKNVVSTLTCATMAAIASGIPSISQASPPVYYESDLMQTSEQKSWAITNVIHTIIANVPEEQIPRLSVTPETKKSLAKVHKVYADDPKKVRMGYLSDLSYAYSYSNASFFSYLGGWVPYIWKHLKSANGWTEDHLDAWRNSKGYVLGAGAGTAATLLVSWKAWSWCRAGAAAGGGGGGAGGGYLASAWATLKGVATTLGSLKVVVPALGAQAGKVCSDYYIAGPYALEHYTNLLVGDVSGVYNSSIADTVYGYSEMDAPVYYEGYLNSYLFYALMRSLMTFRNSDELISFEEIDRVQKDQLWKLNDATTLRSSNSKVLTVCHLLDRDYKGEELDKRQKSCKPQNAKLIKEVVKENSCTKYTFFNEEEAGPKPLTMVNVCSAQGDTAYLKFPELGFASAPKTIVGDILYRVSVFSGASKITAQSLH